MTKKLFAEAPRTFILVLFGCGSAVLAGANIRLTGISLAFGIAIVAAAYGIGANSGAHLNPARSIGPAVFVGGKALADLWVCLVAPLAGGALAGIGYASGLTRAD